MKYCSAQVTHAGLQRTNNEDAFLADDRAGIWLVADGMGGHAGGEVASLMAVKSVREQVGVGLPLAAAIECAHNSIVERAQTEAELAGMGTTIVAAHACGRRLRLAWVGDSRIYLWDAGELKQLSMDHSFVQDMVARGALTPAEAAEHPQKNLIRQALGQTHGRSLEVDELQIRLRQGQCLMLCTDGVHDMLSEQEFLDIFSKTSLVKRIQSLKHAVLQTAAADNFTAIMIEPVAGSLVQQLLPWGKPLYKNRPQ